VLLSCDNCCQYPFLFFIPNSFPDSIKRSYMTLKGELYSASRNMKGIIDYMNHIDWDTLGKWGFLTNEQKTESRKRAAQHFDMISSFIEKKNAVEDEDEDGFVKVRERHRRESELSKYARFLCEKPDVYLWLYEEKWMAQLERLQQEMETHAHVPKKQQRQHQDRNQQVIPAFRRL